MALNIGLGKLHEAIETLHARWENTGARWNDPVRQAFENDYLEPLEKQFQHALGAVERLALAVNTARRECS